MAQFRLRAARRGLPAAIALLVVLAFSASASAATFTPTTTVDGDDYDLADGLCAADLDGNQVADTCTLRAAIMEANAQSADDTIVLPAGTYKLDRGAGDDNSRNGDLDIASGG